MGFMDFIDPSKADTERKLREELADISHNLKRVMEYIHLEYERNPLLEITPEVLKFLRDGNDSAAVESFAQTHNVNNATAAKALQKIKLKLSMGDLNYPLSD